MGRDAPFAKLTLRQSMGSSYILFIGLISLSVHITNVTVALHYVVGGIL